MSSEHFTNQQLYAAETIAFDAADEVSSILQENFGNTPYTTKSGENDWVTKWDELAEERIIRKLGSFSADIGFLGEESGAKGDAEVYWAIDPIDGTRAFVEGIDTCTTMIALVDHGKPVVGVIYDFVKDTSYVAVAGGGAFRNGSKPMHVSSKPISDAEIKTCIRRGNKDEPKILNALKATGANVQPAGNLGHVLSNIAKGDTEGFVSFDNPFKSIWDYAAGVLLIQEAGGKVANVGSNTYTVDNFDFIAANTNTHQQLSKIMGSVGVTAITG